VGLKPLLEFLLPYDSFKPQSNQRGIETEMEAVLQASGDGPQSNQRGIETAARRQGGIL